MNHKPVTFVLFLSCLLAKSLYSLKVEPPPPTTRNAQIRVIGFVYCDICSNNSFFRHSYFMPGSEVRIDCKFRANALKMTEEIAFSVNRTTNRYGVYKFDIPAVDGIECAAESTAIATSCEASLIRTSSRSCNVPGYNFTSDQIAVIKARKPNLCIYSLNSLTFRPSKHDVTLCGH